MTTDLRGSACTMRMRRRQQRQEARPRQRYFAATASMVNRAGTRAEKITYFLLLLGVSAFLRFLLHVCDTALPFQMPWSDFRSCRCGGMSAKVATALALPPAATAPRGSATATLPDSWLGAAMMINRHGIGVLRRSFVVGHAPSDSSIPQR